MTGIPFVDYAFVATGTTTARTLPSRLAEIVNVKDYGAHGDGATDDASAIQAAFNAAYGTTASPHGSTSKYSNKPVFFPAGHYLVGTPLTLRSVMGGFIYGAGSQSTMLEYTGTVTGGGTITSLIRTNGFAYSRVEGLSLNITGDDTVCFNLDWDNTGEVALNANQFVDIVCSNCITGILIGLTGFMGSENSFWGCTFNDCAHAGIKTLNGNALTESVFGCTFNRCSGTPAEEIGVNIKSAAVMAGAGAIPTVVGCKFVDSGACDILHSAGDGAYVMGCISTNSNAVGPSFGPMFIFDVSQGVYVAACTYTGSAVSPTFIKVIGNTICDMVHCTNGTFNHSGGGNLYLRGCQFDNAAYITGSVPPTVVQNI